MPLISVVGSWGGNFTVADSKDAACFIAATGIFGFIVVDLTSAVDLGAEETGVGSLAGGDETAAIIGSEADNVVVGGADSDTCTFFFGAGISSPSIRSY